MGSPFMCLQSGQKGTEGENRSAEKGWLRVCGAAQVHAEARASLIHGTEVTEIGSNHPEGGLSSLP